jgi:hypothetical protein
MCDVPALTAILLSLILPGFAAPDQTVHMVIYLTSPAFFVRQVGLSAPVLNLVDTFEVFNLLRLVFLSTTLRSLSSLAFGWCVLINIVLDLSLPALRFLLLTSWRTVCLVTPDGTRPLTAQARRRPRGRWF